jgi:hypothetical protein
MIPPDLKKQDSSPTENPFNGACMMLCVLLWSFVFIKCLWDAHLDLAKLPLGIIPLFTATTAVLGVIRLLNTYKPRRMGLAMRLTIQFLHCLAVFFPLCAILHLFFPEQTANCKPDSKKMVLLKIEYTHKNILLHIGY